MHKFFAVTAPGFEPAAAAELTRIGASEVTPVNSGVEFSGSLATLYRACLWLRTASRILRPLREFAAGTQEMLYSQTRRVRWEDYLDPRKTLAVYATIEGMSGQKEERRPSPPPPRRGGRDFGRGAPRQASRQGIHNSMFAALKVKDAIVDRLRREQGARPDVDRENPDVIVHAHFAGGRCILSLDAVGPSLHARGYRSETAPAPLKETLAAAIIELIGWDGSVPLYDPLCGSGTLLIEAALKALRIAPGLSRERFACQRWPDFDGVVWQEVFDEVKKERRDPSTVSIWGSDVSEDAIKIAETHATRAGVGAAIQWRTIPFEETQPPTEAPGVLVTNPPYGERLGEESQLVGLYQQFGTILKERFPQWTSWVLAGNLSLAREIGLEATEKIKLFNGPIPCRLLKFPPAG